MLTIVSLLIAKLAHGLVVTLTASGIAMLLILSYLSKPVAEIRQVKEISHDDQLDLFHKKHKIGKKYSKTEAITTKPSRKRKRHLKTLSDKRSEAA